jgi:hypothetical protein
MKRLGKTLKALLSLEARIKLKESVEVIQSSLLKRQLRNLLSEELQPSLA